MNSLLDPCEAPLVSGFRLQDDVISKAEEAALIKCIDTENLSPFRFQQWTGKRLTRSFGWSYDFENGSFSVTDPVPGWLEPVRNRAAAFAGLEPHDLAQALLIRYEPGAGIGWHKDRPVFEHVVGISLGSVASLRLRRRTQTGFKRAKAEILPRSIYHLAGEVRYDWEHSIAPMVVPRWSITFRSLRVGNGKELRRP